ncbi:hypothetical protein M407DRAFT_26250 [Tulasnella calospora MUT 4182]|uniref:DUF8191 domain-containing protein n=1 Tax=Tulasnella calospora MUT 4182 TaxID=1051891 RepID=A0A0C3KSE6_9AGAM|nr:hypothetical protein M407DRAFT_26250 [Tulasnella calospora MUT 4182]
MEAPAKENSASRSDANSQNSDNGHDKTDWKQLYERERARSSKLREQNAALRATVRTHLQDDRGNESSDDEMNDSEHPTAWWDGNDDIERCTECDWEVVRGVCQNPPCGMKYAYDSENKDQEDIQQGVFTWDAYVVSDRFPQPRGSTPLLEVDSSDDLPRGWNGTYEMYEALLARGVTRLMIATFQVTFAEEEGIVAWADDEIYQHFSGPGMKKGDQWGIMLGRRIKLDADDLDGSIFIEDLLEDAVRHRFPADPTWETVRVEGDPKVWLTRPIGERPSDDGEMAGEDSEGESEDDMEEDDNLAGADEMPNEQNPMQVPNGEVVHDRIGDTESPVLHFDDYEPSDTDPQDLPHIVEPLLTIADAPVGESDDGSNFEDDHWMSEGSDDEVLNNPPDSAGLKAEAANEDDQMRYSDSDPPGSDWDSDDDLSGDDVEDLKRQAEGWQYYMTNRGD